MLTFVMKTISILILMAVGCVGSGPTKTDDTHATLACSDPGCVDPATGSGDATTGTDEAGDWWFASGSWHVPYGGPEDSVITGFSVTLVDNGPGNAKPAAPVVVYLRASNDGGSTWTSVAVATSCGCGAYQTLAPNFVYQPTGIVELMLASPTTDPTYVVSMQVRWAFPNRQALGATTAFMENPGSPAAVFVSPGMWLFKSGNSWADYPISMPCCNVIIGYRWWVNKINSGTGIFAQLVAVDSATGARTVIPNSTTASSSSTGLLTLSVSSVNAPITPGVSYVLQVGDKVGFNDSFVDAEVQYVNGY